jgi:hypothetical protein
MFLSALGMVTDRGGWGCFGFDVGGCEVPATSICALSVTIDCADGPADNDATSEVGATVIEVLGVLVELLVDTFSTNEEWESEKGGEAEVEEVEVEASTEETTGRFSVASFAERGDVKVDRTSIVASSCFWKNEISSLFSASSSCNALASSSFFTRALLYF